jgi:hypothetical protein
MCNLTLRKDCFFLPNEVGNDGVRPIKLFFSHDSLTGASLVSAAAKLAMALEGRLGF